MTSKGCQRLLFICILVLMALFMLFYVITGIMLPYLTDFYKLTLTQSGLISSFQYGGETLILFVSGFVSPKASKTKMIAGCFIGTSAALAGIGLHLPFLFLFSFFLSLGVCSGLFIKYASSLIAELYPENRNRYMTILYIATGIGCMAAPYVSTMQLEAGMEWKNLAPIGQYGNIKISVFPHC